MEMEFMIYLIALVIFGVLCITYLINIYRLVKSKEVNGMTLARVVGIFVFPLGAILGFVSNWWVGNDETTKVVLD